LTETAVLSLCSDKFVFSSSV